MNAVISITNAVFGLLFRPFAHVRPDVAILIITSVTGVAMLYLYVWTSDQAGLKAVLNVIKARILEIQLYRTDLHVMLRALGRVFMKNFTYLKLLLPPALFLIFIVVVIVVQCYPRFTYRPVKPGEKIVLTAGVRDGVPVTLTVPDGVVVEAGPVNAPSVGEVSWRLSAKAPGEYDVTLATGGKTETKKLMAGEGLMGISPIRAPLTFEGYITNPTEPPLAKASAFSAIRLDYPKREMNSPLMLGMGWLVYFLVVSFVVALVAKFVTKAH
ncbi:MAG: hypothetical protein HZA22_02190 [Nitrospirae bacterium]|nr:hypothetical protein [Nitrospirota bacterium]